jgi:hypothetical protein
MTSFAIGSNHENMDILALADVMESQGLYRHNQLLTIPIKLNIANYFVASRMEDGTTAVTK